MTRRASPSRPAAPRRASTRPRQTTPLRRLTQIHSAAQGWGWTTGAALWIVLLCVIVTLGFFWGILLGIADGAKALRRAWAARDRPVPSAGGADATPDAPRLSLPAPLASEALVKRTDRLVPPFHHRR